MNFRIIIVGVMVVLVGLGWEHGSAIGSFMLARHDGHLRSLPLNVTLVAMICLLH